MTISAQTVKELREKTGAGMMDCKKALSEASGKIDDAIEILRKKGLQASAKKAGRVAADGLVVIALNDSESQATLVELNCETDFVAKNEEFKSLANDIAGLILKENPPSVEAVNELSLASGSVSKVINNLVGKIGEKMTFRRFVRVGSQPGEKIGSYIHMGSKIGVLIKMKGNGIDDEVLKDVSMHVAASHPLYLKQSDIPQDVLDKEKAIYAEQMKDAGKPANILDKILEGKLKKFASEVCLNDQIFIKDPTGKKSVSKFLKEKDPSLEIVSFCRYQVGEGIEKKADDFADEVAKMAK